MKTGTKIYITTFVKVYEAEILSKDKSKEQLINEPHFIARIKDTNELVSVGKSMITAAPKVKHSRSEHE